MTMATASPTTWASTTFALEAPQASPRTFEIGLAVPKTVEECDRILVDAKRRMRDPLLRPLFVRELARFLGAGSSVWTPDRRGILRTLLASAGEDAVDPVLSAVAKNPRAEVVDEAELVLTSIARESGVVLQGLIERWARTSDPSARALLVNVLADVGPPTARSSIESALSDEAAEVRDAAALAIGRLGGVDAKTILKRRLDRERNPVVLASLRTALDELNSA